MGKGAITSGGTAGLYSVTLELARDRITATISRMNADIATLTIKIAQIQAQIDAVQVQMDTLAAQIAIYEADKIKYAKEYCAAVGNMTTLIATRETYERQKSMEVLKQKALTARIAYLNRSMPADPVVSAWCADLTENLTGAIGTIEIPGERGSVLIQPGYNGNSVYSKARDGHLQPSIAGDPSCVFYNLAMLPGWQKWKPTYRLGVITVIDKTAHTCSVTLDAAASSAQSLNINQGTSLTAVPIEYMTCNSGAFSVGDRVVVKFTGQDFASPKVIGFESNPKACGWQEYWDDSASPLLCKNHQWTYKYGLGLDAELCPALPADRVHARGNATLSISAGILSMTSSANGVGSSSHIESCIDLNCSGSDGPYLNSMILKIKSNCSHGAPSTYGYCVYIKDSAGQAQYLAFGGTYNWSIINGINNSVGLPDGTEKIIDLSIYRPIDPAIGFSQGKLQALRFETWTGNLATNTWEIDTIEIL